MTIHYTIQSSDPELLARATQVAEAFAQRYVRDGIVGIVFLGGIARGYFDTFADIDVAIFKAPGAEIPPPPYFSHEHGFEIQCFFSDYAEDEQAAWDMPRRWAFSSHRIFYDPQGQVAQLLAQKVPLRPEERRWLMIEGMSQSNWYGDALSRLWVARGNLVSAQHMFNDAITHFFDALFALNQQLVADVKWRAYYAEQLPLLPPRYHEAMQELLRVNAFTEEDIERRRQVFLEMWRFVLPLVEAEVQMTFEEFNQLV